MRLLGGGKLRKNIGPTSKAEESRGSPKIDFSALKVDSSVRVSHLDRDEIIMLLKHIKFGVVRENYKTSILKKTLAKELKNRHAIYEKLKMLSNWQLAKLCRQFSLCVRGQKYRPRMMKAVSSYFFEEYPDAPLTNLKRILEEDNADDHFGRGQHVSSVSSGWRPKPIQWRLLGGGKPRKNIGQTTKAQESCDGNYY